MSDAVVLTPSQTDFLLSNIPGYATGPWSSEVAGNAGSDRRFVRVRNNESGRSLVLVLWDSGDADWGRFIEIQSALAGTVPFLPAIYAWDDARGLILEEDFGDLTLCRFCASMRDRQKIEAAYRSVVDALVVWQEIRPDSSRTVSSRSMDLEMFLWESDYFARHCVTEFFGLGQLLTEAWERERAEIAQSAALLPQVCVHRDFQSENVLLPPGRVGFVDFQGARLGPAGYDLASLLYDPYVSSIDDQLVGELISHYRSRSAHELSDADLTLCAIQRLIQALGAYGNLSIHKGKTRYRAFIPLALRRLAVIAQKTAPEYPQFRRILDACIAGSGSSVAR